MNKKLFLLPLLSFSLLVGCGGNKPDPKPQKEIWELDEVEGESTLQQVKEGTAGEYYTVRGTVVANSGSTLAIYRKGQFLYCYNFNADQTNNGGQENLKAHPLGSYVEIHAQSSAYSGSVQLTAYDVGSEKTEKKYDKAASLEVLATQGETVNPVEVTTAEGLANAEAAGKLMKLSFVPNGDKTLVDSGSANQDVAGKVGTNNVSLRLEKYCDPDVRTALLANNPATFADHATYEVVALGAATSDGVVRGLLCEGSSWKKTADAHFDNPTSVIVEAPDEATTLEAGKTLQLQFMVMPAGAKQEVTWTSSNSDAATVENGLVTGIAANAEPVTITAATVADPTVKGTYSLTITAPAAQPLTETVKFDFASVTTTTAAEIKTDSELLAYVTSGSTKVTAAACTKVYFGNGSGGAFQNQGGLIKLATGSANASINFSLTGLANKVVLKYHDFYKASDSYPTTSNTVTINGVEQANPYTADATPAEVTFNLAAASDSILLQTKGRCVIFEITISYVAPNA